MITRPEPLQKLPNGVEKVFEGVIFDVYQWEQEQFDGSKKTFELLKRPDTVIVIAVTDDKKIIVSKQEQPGKAPFIGMLGGRVDEGEDPLAAAKRELLEESGMTSDDWSVLNAQQVTSKIDWVIYTFIARGVKRIKEQNLDSGEKISLQEMVWDEFVSLVSHEDFRDIELSNLFLRAQLDPQLLAKLKHQILG